MNNFLWRETMMAAKVGPFDYRLLGGGFGFILYPSTLTFLLLIAGLGIGYVLNARGLSVPAAMRALRVIIFGRTRYATGRKGVRTMKDYNNWWFKDQSNL